MRSHGTLVKWNDERGFGFISMGASGEEIFVHVSAFPRDGQRPSIGELVSFDVVSGADGKRKAAKVQRPGARGPSRNRDRAAKPGGINLIGALASLAILLAVAGWAYSRWAAPNEVAAKPLAGTPLALPVAVGEKFTCDGRTMCSQMRSCAEAEFFHRNCPGTRMDGNNDGEPCEQQWCN